MSTSGGRVESMSACPDLVSQQHGWPPFNRGIKQMLRGEDFGSFFRRKYPPKLKLPKEGADGGDYFDNLDLAAAEAILQE